MNISSNDTTRARYRWNNEMSILCAFEYCVLWSNRWRFRVRFVAESWSSVAVSSSQSNVPRSSPSLVPQRHSIPTWRCCVGLPSGTGPTTIFIWLPSSCGGVRDLYARLHAATPSGTRRHQSMSCLRPEKRDGHPVRVQQLCGDPNAGSLVVHVRPPLPGNWYTIHQRWPDDSVQCHSGVVALPVHVPQVLCARVPYKKPYFWVMINEVHHANENVYALVSQLEI